MATISITVTDEQAANLPLRVLDEFNRDGSGETEPVTQYVQRVINLNAAHEIEKKREKKFHDAWYAADADDQDTFVEAQKAKSEG